jgi:3-methyladenine DNA glycosylase AlkD
MPVAKKKSTSATTQPADALTAKQFLTALIALPKNTATDNSKYLQKSDDWNKTMGVRMASIFTLAKQFEQMPLDELEKLLDNPYYEARMGAVSIMDFQARNKKTSAATRKQLYELYINKHDRINNWDLVDRSAPFVVGGYLAEKSRAPLYKLAKSKNIWERRTAIVATYFFIRQNDIDDTFKIAELLVHDKEDLINKAVGSWVREAGKRDNQKLLDFLDKHALTMPRVTLRYALEKLSKKQKEFYLNKMK